MSRATRKPTGAEKALDELRTELLQAVQGVQREIAAVAADGRRRDVRLEAVEAKQAGQDKLLIDLNESVHSFERSLEILIKTEARAMRDQVGDFLRTALSEYTSVAKRLAVLEEARYSDALGGNGKLGEAPPPP